MKRKSEGKHILLDLSEEGISMCNAIYECLNRIYLLHSDILDKSHSQQLIHLLHEASERMEKHHS